MSRANRLPEQAIRVLTEPREKRSAVVVTHPGALVADVYDAVAERLVHSGVGVLRLDEVPEYRVATFAGQALELDLDDIAARFALQAAEFAGDRPLTLLGWSFGGVLAFATAQHLVRTRMIERLVLLDSIAPGEDDPGKVFGDSLPDREALDWFAMYFGAKRGTPLGFTPDDFDGLPIDRGLEIILAECKIQGSMHADTSVGGLRKVFRAFVDGILRNKVLQDGFTPERPRYPIHLLRPERGLFDGVSTLGWGALAGDAISVHAVPGDHYTMLSEAANARRVGDEIDRIITAR